MPPLLDDVRQIVDEANAFTVSILQYPNAPLINAQPERALQAVFVRTGRFHARLQRVIDEGADQRRHEAIVNAMDQLGSLLPDRETVALAAASALEASGVNRVTAQSLAPALALHIRTFGKAENALDQVRLWEPPGPDDTAVHEPLVEQFATSDAVDPNAVTAVHVALTVGASPGQAVDPLAETGPHVPLTAEQAQPRRERRARPADAPASGMTFEQLFDAIAGAEPGGGDTAVEMAAHDTATGEGSADDEVPFTHPRAEDMPTDAERAAVMRDA